MQSLHLFSGFIPLGLLQSLSQQRFLALFYHTVSDEPLPHVKHLYQVRDTQLFEQDLDYLLQHYQAISLQQLIDFIYKGNQLPKNSFLLTFDDGLSECSNIIAPILKRKGVPATFFINSDFVDNKALMFRYKASLLVEHLQKKPYPTQELEALFAQYQLSYDNAKTSFLAVRWKQQDLLDEIAALLDFDFDHFLQEKKPYLDRQQIQAMLEDGFTFGSHSQNHPTYNSISLKAQMDQTIHSQRFLQDQFDLDYKTFAFPFTDHGVSKDFFDRILKEEQFQLTFGGAGLKRESIKGQIQRFGMETQQKTSAKKLIHSEYCYYLIKAIFGKNRIVRNSL